MKTERRTRIESETDICRTCGKRRKGMIWTVDPTDRRKDIVALCQPCYKALRDRLYGGEL